MPLIIEDQWIASQAGIYDLTELADCSIAVDATYWLASVLETDGSANEPLLSALGGLTGIEARIIEELDQWKAHNMEPFFILDGQSLTGQDQVTLKRGQSAIRKTNEAWDLYFRSHAEEAVRTFGENAGAFNVRNVYPLLQRILKSRGLHFLRPPYNACAQLAYFEMIDSDQCAGVMGPQELLAYPIKDSVISNIDWAAGKVSAISKRTIMRNLSISEAMLIDALLMTGTSFLEPFPPLLEKSIYPENSKTASITNAVNLLRTSDKSVANACNSFSDILQAQDPDWLDKFRKARMAVHHFIHIAESGEVRVNDYDHLTQDNHEYLGLQLPEELFHYLNTGLIGASVLNCITHSQILIQPTMDGEASPEYKKLVTSQIVPIKEQTLSLIVPRVHRGIGHKAITMRAWFDPEFSQKMNHSALVPAPSLKVGSWDVKEADVKSLFPEGFAGPVAFEVLALLTNSDFVAKTIAKNKPIKGIDSTEMVASVAIWRFLHLRSYVNDSHVLTSWGHAFATVCLSLQDVTNPVPGLDEAALLAFELVQHGLLNGRPRESQSGYPRKGTEEEKASLALISECASLLRLRHEDYGYTGPLNRGLLAFRSLSTTVREADRDLIEAIVASMFMFGQSRRDRSDQLEISQKLPFATEPDIAMGIAVRTFFDDDDINDDKATRAERLQKFPSTYVPHAQAFEEDFRICVAFFSALNRGIQSLNETSLPAADKVAWANAQAYLDARPF